MPTVTSITIQTTPSDHDAQPPHFSRTPVQSIELVVGHGILGDLKAGKNPQRQLNLMSAATLAQLAAEGFSTAPGQMGEQMVVDGLDIDALQPGDRLRLGTALVEIHGPRRGCSRFEAIQGLSPKLAAGRMGQMAFVIESGVVSVGDTVSAAANETAAQ